MTDFNNEHENKNYESINYEKNHEKMKKTQNA